MRTVNFAFVLFGWLLFVKCAAAIEPHARVEDRAGYLTSESRDYLESLIRQAESDGKASIRMLVVTTAKPRTLDQVIDEWASAPNSSMPDALIALAAQERIVRIRPGRRAAQRLPDYAVREMQTEMMQLLGPDDGRLKAFDLGVPMLARALAGDLSEFDAPAVPAVAGERQRAVPAPAPLVDEVPLLQAEAAQRVRRRIEFIQRAGQVEIGVVLVPDSGSETVRDYANRIMRQWRLGAATQRGVLLLLTQSKHEVIALVGYDLESTLDERRTDYIAQGARLPGGRSFAQPSALWEQRVAGALDRLAWELGVEAPPDQPQASAGRLAAFAKWAGGFLVVGFVLQWWLRPWIAAGAAALATGASAWYVGVAIGVALAAVIAVLLFVRYLPVAVLSSIGRGRYRRSAAVFASWPVGALL